MIAPTVSCLQPATTLAMDTTLSARHNPLYGQDAISVWPFPLPLLKPCMQSVLRLFTLLLPFSTLRPVHKIIVHRRR